MSAAKNVNGYLIKNVSPNEWWMITPAGEKVAGPFPTEKMTVEVAEVFEDLAPPARSRNSQS
ncbi:hypothetical protein NTD86_20885 [Pseudomonas sp. 7P_10.2_Bac1]|nr:hypothetical protein [Pseudomonas sp. 7P_10.2_Bac1]MCU1729433.1 hypothetical protein [Pseudomonas sp. 7P_10.2_Bac1]